MNKIFSILIVFIILFADSFSQKSNETSNEGFRRYPLYEEVTNASCGPCASSNPSLNAYLTLMKDSLVGVTYHAWWPGVNDPMYQHNTQQNRDRIQYMKGNVNATPWLNVDGIVVDVWPFTSGNLAGAYNTRLAVTTPLKIVLTHQRISTDSVEVKVQTTLLSELVAGTYKLRVFAVEDPIKYTTAPGPNGEKYFPDVFRKAVPSSSGDVFPATVGLQEFVYRYKFESAWVDSNLFSIAFVQNDITKEVINASSSRFKIRPTSIDDSKSYNLPNCITLFDNYPNPFNPSTLISFSLPKASKVSLIVYDNLGRVVKILVNEDKPAGKHQMSFNASELSSGIYFYTLRADNFTETKKLILIK
jgi:hypothetical protein